MKKIIISLFWVIALLPLLGPLAGATLTVSFSDPTPANGSMVYNNLSINTAANGADFANLTVYVYSDAYALVSQTNGTTPLSLNITGLSEIKYFFNASAWDTANVRYDSETREVNITLYGITTNTYYKEYNKDLYTIALGIILMAIGLIAVITMSLQDMGDSDYGYTGRGGEEW